MHNKPTFVFFHAPAWCRPCHTMLPLVEQVSEEAQEPVTYADIDNDEFRALAGSMGVRSVPTLVKLDSRGKPEGSLIGVASLPSVQMFMTGCC